MMRRIKKIQKTYLRDEYSSLFITRQVSIRYLTGFSGSFAVLLITPGEAYFFTDFRYIERSRAEVKGAVIRKINGNFIEKLAKLPRKLLGKTMGFEADYITVDTHRKLKEAFPHVKLIGLNGIVNRFSQIKDVEEIRLIEKSVQLTDSVFEEVVPLIRPGISELDITAEIDYLIKKKGGEGIAFNTIVASGPNSSMPHAVPTMRRIKPGDFVLMDFGAVYRGYHADFTRTVVVGKPTHKQSKVYAIVLKAQKAAIRAARAGISCSDLDSRARRIIEREGYGPQFGHSLGHGIGLAIHEEPRVSASNDALLKRGMVTTIEPGIYLPGWGGVRIEDVVVIEKENSRTLTRSPKHLISL